MRTGHLRISTLPQASRVRFRKSYRTRSPRDSPSRKSIRRLARSLRLRSKRPSRAILRACRQPAAIRRKVAEAVQRLRIRLVASNNKSPLLPRSFFSRLSKISPTKAVPRVHRDRVRRRNRRKTPRTHSPIRTGRLLISTTLKISKPRSHRFSRAPSPKVSRSIRSIPRSVVY